MLVGNLKVKPGGLCEQVSVYLKLPLCPSMTTDYMSQLNIPILAADMGRACLEAGFMNTRKACLETHVFLDGERHVGTYSIQASELQW